MKQITTSGIKVFHDLNSYDAKTIIINTCGFINDAKQESIDTILRFARAKKDGKINKLLVMGCLSERYKEELKKELPEVDEYFGVDNVKDILTNLNIDYKKELLGERILTTPKHYAYLKISEGCNRKCSFCAIPLIRGKHISKPIETIVEEAQKLVESGVKELILIAQDLSYYGYDIYGKYKLPLLLEKLSKIKHIEWIRLHYLYPLGFPEDIISVIKNNQNICKYIDIPFQHISNNVLKKMHRGNSKTQTYELIKKLRKEIPDIALRSTILVGHPGESDNDFNQLIDFIKEVRFDRLGVFAYSNEENTYSYNNYSDSIPESVKQQRVEKIMEIQQSISTELNEEKIGNTYKTLIDREEGNFFVGRTEYDSPEVDNEVLIAKNSKTQLILGKFYNVKIQSASDYDLYGDVSTN